MKPTGPVALTPSTLLPTITRYWPVLLWYAVILGMSSLSGRRLDDVGIEVPDKLVHAVEYGILGFLLIWRAPGTRNRTRVLVTAFVVVGVLGAVDEVYQGTVPGRTPSVADWTADVTGALLGAELARWRANRRRPPRTDRRERS